MGQIIQDGRRNRFETIQIEDLPRGCPNEEDPQDIDSTLKPIVALTM